MRDGAKGRDFLYTGAMEPRAMTLGPTCERGRDSSSMSGCHCTIRKRIAYWVITKRDLTAPSIQTSMVPSARSHLGSCMLARLENGKRASSGLDTAL
jgi:hypothetical protein